jgi:hypothetical protein
VREDVCLIASFTPSIAGQRHILSSALALTNPNGRAGAGGTRCSALPESNGVWSSKGRPASTSSPSERQWSKRDSWSVQKPLHLPLEDAIHRGNWREAKGLVDKLLSVGSLRDISNLDKLIKGISTALPVGILLSCIIEPVHAEKVCIDMTSILQAYVWMASSRRDGDCSNSVWKHFIPWVIQLIRL